jgi:hypothetical protein
MKRKHNHLEKLIKQRLGYVMFNEQENVEVKCTPEFKRLWVERGFKVKEEKSLQLVNS